VIAVGLFGAATLALGLLTAAGALHSWTRWPVLFPFGWQLTVCIPGGAAFLLLAVYGTTKAPIAGLTGIALLAAACVAVFVTPHPFDASWARGIRRR
jgi:uncharacterized membrane protein